MIIRTGGFYKGMHAAAAVLSRGTGGNETDGARGGRGWSCRVVEREVAAAEGARRAYVGGPCPRRGGASTR